MYYSSVICVFSLPKKSVSSLTTPDILSYYWGIMYNCCVVLGDIGVIEEEFQGIGAAIQTTQQVILVTTTNLRIINDNVKLFRQDL